MPNLTFDAGLLKEHTPEPLEGHAVVVFRRVGEAGEVFHSVLLPGAPPVKPGLRLPFRKPGEYFAYAVDTAPERHLDFFQDGGLDDGAFEFGLGFNLSYAVSDPVALARSRSLDPLGSVRDRVRGVIGWEFEPFSSRTTIEVFLRARDLVDFRMEELREFAGAYGIAIHSIRLTPDLAGERISELQLDTPGNYRLRVTEARRRRIRDAAHMIVRGEKVRGRDRDEARGPEPTRASPAAEAAPAEPAATPEPVLLGGAAPRRARPGDVILAQFAAYVKRFEEQARRALEREAPPGDVRLDQETDCRWAVGARVTVTCTARGLTVFTPTQSFVWDGECRTASFEIEVPARAEPRSTVIVMEAFVHDSDDAPDAVQVGRLRMALEIGDHADDRPPRRVHGEAARTAFASYAWEDRIDVLERVSSIRRSTGMEVFVDVVSLRVGDDWEKRLREQITASERFLLFWSELSAMSEWVEWEWQQALTEKGEDALELHLLRHTPIDSIPERLRKYHFNDVYLLARDAELHRRESAAPAPAAGAPPAGVNHELHP